MDFFQSYPSPVIDTDMIDHSDDAPASAQGTPGLVNHGSFKENNAVDTTSAATNGAHPQPEAEDVSAGIQPVADFIPKDAAPHSHPTPPPDQPLTTGESDADVTMGNASDEAAVALPASSEPAVSAAPEVAPASETAPVFSASADVSSAMVSASESAPAPEPSLVRPREDDVDDEAERVAKRARFDEDAKAEESTDAPAPVTDALHRPAVNETPAVTESVPAPVDDPVANEVSQASSTAPPPAANDVQPSIEPQSATGTPAPTTTPATVSAAAPKYSTAPMTALQKKVLLEKIKNLKKTKHVRFFQAPVDPVALNIPSYFDIIKNPMDVSTMEKKLKDDKYASVQALMDDFHLILGNSRKFNGDAHPVTVEGMNMQAYFERMVEQVPSADQVAPPKQAKKASPARPPQRREQRQPPPAPAAPAPAPAKTEAYAAPDGVPQIRRESTNGRPARAIKPPANRDIPYAKPKRKEHQLELRFCEYALEQLRGPRYASVNHVFQMPVDPVALNIPHYRQVIKHPMDMSTMAQKLKQGEYGKASEFQKDFHLMIENCLIFNPAGNPVRDMGIQFRRHFDELWKQKDKWERQNKPESARHTSASADEDSDAEEDAEDDEPEDDKQQTIVALQKQLADMQNLISGMAAGGVAKPKNKDKKAKTKDSKRKSGAAAMNTGLPRAKLPAPKPKKVSKPKPVTYEEKQEISEAVGNMSEDQVQVLTKMITDNVPKYADQEDMELEIDELPSHVQSMLLKYVRSIFGRPRNAQPMSPPDDGEMEDDDFEPPARSSKGEGAANKRKKHKPMGKREQQEQIEKLSSKLEQFKQVGTSGSESPTGASNFHPAKQEESSGDDESEESEEE